VSVRRLALSATTTHRRQTRFQQLDHGQVQIFPTVEQDEIDRAVQVSSVVTRLLQDVITSSKPVSANVCLRQRSGFTELRVTTRPRRCHVPRGQVQSEMPKDMPNRRRWRRVARTSEYNSRPASGVTGM